MLYSAFCPHKLIFNKKYSLWHCMSYHYQLRMKDQSLDQFAPATARFDALETVFLQQWPFFKGFTMEFRVHKKDTIKLLLNAKILMVREKKEKWT